MSYKNMTYSRYWS